MHSPDRLHCYMTNTVLCASESWDSPTDNLQLFNFPLYHVKQMLLLDENDPSLLWNFKSLSYTLLKNLNYVISYWYRCYISLADIVNCRRDSKLYISFLSMHQQCIIKVPLSTQECPMFNHKEGADWLNNKCEHLLID